MLRLRLPREAVEMGITSIDGAEGQRRLADKVHKPVAPITYFSAGWLLAIGPLSIKLLALFH